MRRAEQGIGLFVLPCLLKRAELNPDSTGGSDQITFTYNRQSQVTVMVDQCETTCDYDKLDRQTQDGVTALGTAVDGAVRRIASTSPVRVRGSAAPSDEFLSSRRHSTTETIWCDGLSSW